MKIFSPLVILSIWSVPLMGAEEKLPENVREMASVYLAKRAEIDESLNKDYAGVLKKMLAKYISEKENERAALVQEEIKTLEGTDGGTRAPAKSGSASLAGSWYCTSGLDVGAVILIFRDGSFIRNVPYRVSHYDVEWYDGKSRVKIVNGKEILFTVPDGRALGKGPFSTDSFSLPYKEQNSIYVRVK